jgi:DNA phosphorothioation-associated putative methyltransferase
MAGKSAKRTVERHRSALTRGALSRPMTRAVDDRIITADTSVLDYGCGRGGDVARLAHLGVAAVGYDPVFAPSECLGQADVVNLGYVVNVIEDVAERQRTLQRAWDLTARVLVVSARLTDEARQLSGARPHGDGFLTAHDTFQKLFTQEELRAWITSALATHPVTAAPGIFYVFRDPQAEQAFLANRVRRLRPAAESSDALFDQHQELLASLMHFIEERGRLPRSPLEFEQSDAVVEQLGSLRRAFQVIKRITGDERWDRIRLARYEDLLVYVALARFERRPRMSELPLDLQHDMREFFGSYKAACDQADRLLFSIADDRRVAEACRAARVGKRTPAALYIHKTALSHVPTVLRALEGCARALTGEVDATLIKLHFDKPQVSYLGYRTFDADPHPALSYAYVVNLERARVRRHDYRDASNPPVLHRKELFVARDYPGRDKFARLTRQEERAGLYGDPASIGTRVGWEQALSRSGFALRGHRLVRRSNVSQAA